MNDAFDFYMHARIVQMQLTTKAFAIPFAAKVVHEFRLAD
jgi:hypothetical protein